MLSPVERRDLLWELADRLHSLACVVDRGRHWGKGATAGHVGSYLQRLLAHLTRADGKSAQGELRLLQSYHREMTSWSEEGEWVLQVSSAHPDFAALVPLFFEAACVHDAAVGSAVAQEMLGTILQVCDVFLEADLAVDGREHLLRAEIHTVLVQAIRDHSRPH